MRLRHLIGTADIGQKRSFTGAMSKVRLRIRKRSFGRRASDAGYDRKPTFDAAMTARYDFLPRLYTF
jgi:hypothetical protein